MSTQTDVGTLCDDAATVLAVVADASRLPSEIEAAVMIWRTRCQALADTLRASYGLKAAALTAPLLDLAQAMLAAGQAAIAAKPPLIEITLASPMTAHELAWQRYQDLTRVAEILWLNHIPNGNRLASGQTLRIYSR